MPTSRSDLKGRGGASSRVARCIAVASRLLIRATATASCVEEHADSGNSLDLTRGASISTLVGTQPARGRPAATDPPGSASGENSHLRGGDRNTGTLGRHHVHTRLVRPGSPSSPLLRQR